MHLRSLAAAFAAAVVAWPLVAPEVRAETVEVTAKPISAFRTRSAETRFGAFDYVGGFEFSGRGVHSISSFRFRDGGSRFLSVNDEGHWFAGTIRRDEAGRPVGIAPAQLEPLLGADGQPLDGKVDADAESMAIDGNRVLVGFERHHRILAYADPAAPFANRPAVLPLPLPRHELRINRGMETIAVSPEGGALNGAAVAIAERSLDAKGNLFAAIFGGGARGGVFTVRRDVDWDATDGAFLPDGDLLLLERRYTGFLGGLGMRIRRLPGASIRPGALIDGPVILEADLSNEIDNMEGLDAWTDAGGETRIALISDDNGSFLQRNVYLEFRLVADGGAAGALSSGPAR
ncbi:esterase-like activity of phytase family protein [Mangrovicella endophytica]|uniref:esterase-like activity of phytase family protein n=1 Tax=Mangrovicella endophytica TaxID=2066697 RepID=UPI000C9E6303|nr:esterase-like activity of phytase family protein [Mangrovicella endophytica]